MRKGESEEPGGKNDTSVYLKTEKRMETRTRSDVKSVEQLNLKKEGGTKTKSGLVREGPQRLAKSPTPKNVRKFMGLGGQGRK